MALDGIVIANITNELNKILTGSRITKIAQPEKGGTSAHDQTK